MKTSLCAITFLCAAACAATRVEVTADNSIVIYPGEEHLNAGSATRIRIKGNQHLVAMQFDTAALRGQIVREATLVCGQADQTIDGVTFSTIAAPWDEAKSNALTSGAQAYDGWAWPGARFTDVTGSNSFTLVSHAGSDIRDGVYYWAVDPDLIQAVAVGAAYGLTIHEVSSDYSRNPTIYSREQTAKRPYLLVTFGGDEPPPQPPRDLQLAHQGDLSTLRLSLTAPAAGFAYEVQVNGRPLPRWNIPFVEPGAQQVIPIRDIELQPGGRVTVVVTTLDRLGRKAQPVTVSAALPRPEPPPRIDSTLPPEAARPADLAVIPLLDKYDIDGHPVGDLPADYPWHNAVFDGQTIRLSAARGEVVGFQALLKGRGTVTVECDLGGLRTDLSRAVYVQSKRGRIPDPLVPFERLELSPDQATPVAVDVYVPFDLAAREVTGELAISDGRRVPIRLKVHDFALPRRASFLCEMNSYGLPERMSEFYRLQQIAYDHRVHCNILYYGHSSAAPGARKCVMDKLLDVGPGATGRRMDEQRYNDIQPGATTTYWDDFVAAFGPYLSGECFRDGHRGAIPAPGFYLSFHESWPLNVRAYFNGNPDAYEAFRDTPVYAETFVNLVRDFRRLAREQGWNEAGFQIYLNNKGKLDDPRRSPWILDEPTAYWDYRALAYYADLVRIGKDGDDSVRIDYRIDISRPQFDRGELWGKADLWVVGSRAMRQHPRLVRDRAERSGERIWVYGTSNPVEESNRTIQAWVLEAYGLGAGGLVPWQTIDRSGKAMREADQLGLFIFAPGPDGKKAVYPSLRLKAYRRAEQDVEYLALLRERRGWTRDQTQHFIAEYVPLDGRVRTTSAEDAGTAEYDRLSAEGFRRLRAATATLLTQP